ncbi:EmrB/QacA subfamily drug resistance transporter [Actinoplanes campanulatus]|uniref:EmrB/QacA subfamily drug resistance transporter n=1 Tax=Actinoplanes campanulatus TaxID=113559 RepID=A0A7W5FER6_9ACTN|nr:MFS transporter [Actinoplanes campanulatus]MBB3095739.1 EmrB/QacA subfamily drug resistance transporter [Actinoplanes campanulatus]GGN11181.1 putative drug resistance transporter, EmrB/QacA family protein [Actinoplanes campanulatus]GID36636.1 putative drug resistance transporter, EmrB/QacA family protein [Actinoplanes campanulatus]
MSAMGAAATPHRRIALFGLCLAAGMVWLAFADAGIVLPTVAQELDIDLTDLQWVNNAFSLACGVVVLSAGRFSDVYGRRLMFLIGTVMFGVFGLLSALLSGLPGLIAGRALMGVGAALILPATLALIPVMFDRDSQPGAFGTWMAVAWVGQAAGPAVGGLLTATVGWRAILWMNAPLAVLAFYLVLRYCPESRDVEAPRGVDVAGLLTSGLAAFLLLYACTAGQEDGFGSPLIVACFVASAVLWVAFVVVEGRVRNPLVELRLFQARDFDGALVANLTMNLVFAGISYVLALYLQDVRGYSPFVAGCLLLPATVTILVFNPIGQRIGQRRGPRGPILTAMFIMALGALVAGILSTSSPYWLLAAGLLVLGAGIGLLSTPLSDTAVAGPPADLAGTASGLFKSTSMLGGSLGVALLAAASGAFQTNAGTRLGHEAGLTDGQLDRLRQALTASKQGQSQLAGLSDADRMRVIDGYHQAQAAGAAGAVKLAAVIALACGLLLLWLWPRSRRTPGATR